MNSKAEMSHSKQNVPPTATKLEPVRDQKRSMNESDESKSESQTMRSPANNSSRSTAQSADQPSESQNGALNWIGSQAERMGISKDVFANGYEKAEEIASGAMERGSQLVHEVEKSASSRPILAVAAAAGVGFLVGGLVSKSMRT